MVGARAELSLQEPAPPSSTGGSPSSGEDAPAKLPVSLDRIRVALAQPPPTKPLLSGIDRPPDFKIAVEERRSIEEILSTLDFKTGPVPAGGLYGYEQQQRLFNPVNNPLTQPYAAFSGSELLTVAIENLIIKYLGGRVVNAVTSAERAAAEAAARAEVEQAIGQYCAAQAARRESLTICTR